MTAKLSADMRYKLHVLIRDETPVIHLNEPVRLRLVAVELTTEQCEQLKLRMNEDISICFLEPKP